MVPRGQQPGLPSSIVPSISSIPSKTIGSHRGMPPYQHHRPIFNKPPDTAMVQNQMSQHSSQNIENKQRQSTASDQLILTLLAEKSSAQSQITTRSPAQQELMSIKPPGTPMGQDQTADLTNERELCTCISHVKNNNLHSPEKIINNVVMDNKPPRTLVIQNPIVDLTDEPELSIPSPQINTLPSKIPNQSHMNTTSPDGKMENKQRQCTASDQLILTLLAEKSSAQSQITTPGPAQQTTTSITPTSVTMVPGIQQPGLPSSMVPSISNIPSKTIESHRGMPPYQHHRTMIDKPPDTTMVQNQVSQQSPQNNNVHSHNRRPMYQHPSYMQNTTLDLHLVPNRGHGVVKHQIQPLPLPQNGNVPRHVTHPYQAQQRIMNISTGTHQSHEERPGTSSEHLMAMAHSNIGSRLANPTAFRTDKQFQQQHQQNQQQQQYIPRSHSGAPTYIHQGNQNNTQNMNMVQNQCLPTVSQPRRQTMPPALLSVYNTAQSQGATANHGQQTTMNYAPTSINSFIGQRPIITSGPVTSSCYSDNSMVQSHGRTPHNIQQGNQDNIQNMNMGHNQAPSSVSQPNRQPMPPASFPQHNTTQQGGTANHGHQTTSSYLPTSNNSVIHQRPSITSDPVTSSCHSNSNMVQSHGRTPNNIQQGNQDNTQIMNMLHSQGPSTVSQPSRQPMPPVSFPQHQIPLSTTTGVQSGLRNGGATSSANQTNNSSYLPSVTVTEEPSEIGGDVQILDSPQGNLNNTQNINMVHNRGPSIASQPSRQTIPAISLLQDNTSRPQGRTASYGHQNTMNNIPVNIYRPVDQKIIRQRLANTSAQMPSTSHPEDTLVHNPGRIYDKIPLSTRTAVQSEQQNGGNTSSAKQTNNSSYLLSAMTVTERPSEIDGDVHIVDNPQIPLSTTNETQARLQDDGNASSAKRNQLKPMMTEAGKPEEIGEDVQIVDSPKSTMNMSVLENKDVPYGQRSGATNGKMALHLENIMVHNSGRIQDNGHQIPLSTTSETQARLQNDENAFEANRSQLKHMMTVEENPEEIGRDVQVVDSPKVPVIASRVGEHHACSICGMTFKEIHRLNLHETKHEKEQDFPHVCSHCGKRFDRKYSLKIHIYSHTGVKPYSCVHCSTRFVELSALNVHSRLHTGDRPYICKECGKGYHTSSILKDHVQTHRKDRPNVCSVCGKKYKLYKYLSIHMKNVHMKKAHSDDRPKVCSVCGKCFTTSASLKKHMVLHSGEKSHVCSVCGKSFYHAEGLKKHNVTHNVYKVHYKCSFCDKRYATKGGLKTHEQSVHTGKRYTCSYCDKELTTPLSLRMHIRTHTGEKPHVCKVCKKRFSQDQSLEKHMRIHTGEKPYICETCGTGFNQIDSLKRHIRIHTGEKPYVCLDCGKGFRQSSLLTNHIKHRKDCLPKRNAECAYSNCNLCVKGFLDLPSLKNHIKTHKAQMSTC